METPDGKLLLHSLQVARRRSGLPIFLRLAMNPNPFIFRFLCRAITIGCKKYISYEAPLPDGSKIFACNHPTNIDPAYFYHKMGDPVMLIMKWGLDVPIAGRIMRGCGHIAVSSNGHSAYCAALNALLSGRNVYICPEGKLSEFNAKPKTGAVRLAIQAGVPIVPVGIRHYGKICSLNIGKNAVKFAPFGLTRIRFGRPRYHFDYDFCVSKSEATVHLMNRIRELSS